MLHLSTRLGWGLCLGVVTHATVAAGQTPPAPVVSQPAQAVTVPLLDDAEPPADGNDWLQHGNGEWLQGELLGLHDGNLEFDSDEFDEQELDFRDVKRLFLRRPSTIGLEDLSTLTGPAELKGDALIVHTAQGPRSIPRSEILTIVTAATSEWQRWSLDASVGLTVIQGNSEQATLTSNATLERVNDFTRLKLEYAGTYTESKREAIAHSQRGGGRFDIALSRTWFLVPAQLVGEYDEFKNVEISAAALSGAGAHIIDTPDVEWDVTVGAGYYGTRYISVESGVDPTRNNFALGMTTEFDADITSDIDLTLQYMLLLVATEIELTTHHVVLEFEVDLTDVFDLNLRLTFDRTEEPVADENGNRPESNDFRSTVALGVELG